MLTNRRGACLQPITCNPESGGNAMDPKICLESGPAAPELQLRASLEIRETPQIREDALRELKALIRADDSLHCSSEDEYLLRFLRPTKFYPDSAHKLIKDYYSHMKKYADLYANVGPTQQSALLDNYLVSVSPVRDQFGRRVTILKFGAWNSKMGTMDDLYRAAVQCAELGVTEPTTQMMGCVTILDMKGTSLRHVANLTPSYAKKTVDLLQGNFPMRFKAFHVVNQPRIFDLIFAMFKPFLGSKIKSRIHFHGSDMKSLHNHVTPACLTKDYKGQLNNFDQDGLIDTLHDNEHIFKEIRNFAFEQQK